MTLVTAVQGTIRTPVRGSSQFAVRPNLLTTLLSWREHPSFGWPEWLTLAIYIGAVARVIPYHERWADEVQAWYLATDSTVWDILRHRMHYEGAPALWHLILHAFHLLGGTVFGMNWLGATFAAAGVFVFLRWSPFPLLLRVLLPLTYFFAYQYAVIARSYTLFALLCFGLCVLYTQPRRWVWFIIIAGLLSNLSLQGAVVAFIVVILFLFDQLRSASMASSLSSEQTSRPQVPRSSAPWRIIWRPILLFLPFLVFCSVVAMPAPDVNFAVPSRTEGTLHNLLVIFPGKLPKTMPDAPFDPRLTLEAQPAEPAFHLLSPEDWIGWYTNLRGITAEGVVLPQSSGQATLEFILGMAAQATWPVATSKILACIFLILWACWLKSVRFLRGILLWMGLILVGQLLWVSDHHGGLLLIALITVTWIARARVLPSLASLEQRTVLLDRSFVLLFALIAVLQVHWTFLCMRNDIYGKYAPGQETAEVIRALQARNPDARIAGFDSMDATVQPYFEHNPFFNMPHRFWVWSETDNPNAHHQVTIATHPDLVLFTDEMTEPGVMRNTWATLSVPTPAAEQRDLTRNPIVNDLRENGYVETNRFCGRRFSRDGASFINCHILFEPGQPKTTN